MKKILSHLLLTLALMGVLIPSAVLAYQKTQLNVTPQNDFVVGPGKTELFLNPGESVTKNITITNRIDRTVEFILSAEDLVGSNDPGQAVKLLGDERGPYSIKDLIKPEINKFTLELGEQITIPVTISIPFDAEPRGYYGALIIANQPEKLNEQQSTEVEGKTRIISRIGSLFLVRVNGEGKEEGVLTGFKTIGPEQSVYQKRPTGFEIAYQNTGTVHLVPYGEVTVKNMVGKIVAQLPVDAYFVLPDSTRYREVQWAEGFGFGRYTASLSLYKGYGNANETANIAFWIMPWKTLAIGFVGLILLVALLYYIFTRFEIKKK